VAATFSFVFQDICYCISFPPIRVESDEFGMIEDLPPARRRRMSANGMIFRRRRLARLREGLTYDEIAGEEGVSRERIRQIASEVLQKRPVDSGADHAKLQLDRLAPAVQLGAKAIAAGDISAITPYLKALDRYRSVAGAHQVYDDEARKKLMERINRMAENLGIDEAAGREHLKKTGQIPADEPGEAEGPEAPAGSNEVQPEGPSEPAQWMSV
jgi:transcriptional regulator with XRE-family HTH domain